MADDEGSKDEPFDLGRLGQSSVNYKKKTHSSPDSESSVLFLKTCEVLFDRSPVAIAYVDTDFRWARVNKATTRLLGWTQSELVGNSIWDITIPSEARIEQEELKRLQEGEIKSHDMTKTFFHKHQFGVTVEVTMLRVESPNGELAHYVKFFQTARLDPQFMKVEKHGDEARIRPFVPLAVFLWDHWKVIVATVTPVVTATGLLISNFWSNYNDLKVKDAEREREYLQQKWELDNLKRELEQKRLIRPE